MIATLTFNLPEERDEHLTAVHGMDYLLTWNCKHIANAVIRPRIEGICRAAGYEPPVICTPEELLEE